MKNKFATQLKKNANLNTPLGEAAAIGAIASSILYVALFLFNGGLQVGQLLGCALFGLLGGACPELIFLVAGKTIPIVRSWTMVAVILVLLPMSLGFPNMFGYVFLFGYLAYLLNAARKKGLPDT